MCHRTIYTYIGLSVRIQQAQVSLVINQEFMVHRIPSAKKISITTSITRWIDSEVGQEMVTSVLNIKLLLKTMRVDLIARLLQHAVYLNVFIVPHKYT